MELNETFSRSMIVVVEDIGIGEVTCGRCEQRGKVNWIMSSLRAMLETVDKVGTWLVDLREDFCGRLTYVGILSLMEWSLIRVG